ncbi:hypothetical protein NLJ89_g7030 [Agrocybe chaxingu]|uniref:Protein kinase domain-containing protein n=1 Tax=Agrocybe chaxingu TaxID=84603 RepID=A0A9W8K4D3_9AGAR|nr:hypothetical protein NLJ89_g7030 [Agrocybe chaxingu]
MTPNLSLLVNPGYVLKEYNSKTVKIGREVHALDDLGQLIASDPAARVLVMKEVRGKTLAKMAEDLTPDREKWKGEWKPKVAAAAAAIAKSKDLYHMDLNLDNIVIDGSKIQFIDWELYWERVQGGFTDDKEKIERDLQTVWDTPSKIPKSNSPSASNKKSSSPRGSPNKKSRSPSSVKKSGSPKRRSARAHRREVFYD